LGYQWNLWIKIKTITIIKLTAVITTEIQNRTESVLVISRLNPALFLLINEWIKANKEVLVWIYTRYYVIVIVGEGGICYLITGIKATKAIIKAAIDAILSAKF